MPILAERGYLILAVNNQTDDYVAQAQRLARSIKRWHPESVIALVTDQPDPRAPFDHVIVLPYGDRCQDQEWKLANDWQVFRASPFRQTIKLEADMIMSSPCDHWWEMFQHQDLVVSTGCRDMFDRRSHERRYRRVFDNNNLPDVYNAITYWRVSQTAKEFFDWVRWFFDNWDQARTLLKVADPEPTTDVVYAMAAVVMGPERVTQPWAKYPSIMHMKPGILDIRGQDWREELIWESDQHQYRVNTVAQWGAVHYNQRSWVPDEQ